MSPPPILAIVVPCFNEQETLQSSAKTLNELLEKLISSGKISPRSFVCFIDDGSTDETREIIRVLSTKEGGRFRGIFLSRNFGHQAALLAGLFSVRAEAYVSIDADLQDDETKIEEMVARFRAGDDIVYGVRARRDTDSFFKKWTAKAFYGIRSKLCGDKAVPDSADFRLMSRRAVLELRRFRETNLYLRGIVPLLGFSTSLVFYDRKKREFGESKYPLSKMLKLAWNGIVNFSDAPLKMVTGIGFAGAVFCVGFLVYILVQWWCGNTVAGWATTVFSVAAVGSIQMISLGIIGSYLGKTFLETKRRPTFIVDRKIGGNAEDFEAQEEVGF